MTDKQSITAFIFRYKGLNFSILTYMRKESEMRLFSLRFMWFMAQLSIHALLIA